MGRFKVTCVSLADLSVAFSAFRPRWARRPLDCPGRGEPWRDCPQEASLPGFRFWNGHWKHLKEASEAGQAESWLGRQGCCTWPVPTPPHSAAKAARRDANPSHLQPGGFSGKVAPRPSSKGSQRAAEAPQQGRGGAGRVCAGPGSGWGASPVLVGGRSSTQIDRFWI